MATRISLAAAPHGATDRRGSQRYLLQWRVRIDAGINGDHHGRTLDLSPSGAAVLLDQDFRVKGQVRLHLSIPPVNNRQLGRRCAEIVAEPVYSILDSKHGKFRVGFSFTRFHVGKEELESRLAHSRPAPASVTGRDADGVSPASHMFRPHR